MQHFFKGFYVGSASLVTPVYSTEISETSIRGILGSFFAFGVASGTLLDNALGSFMHWYDLTILISLLPGKYLCNVGWRSTTSYQLIMFHSGFIIATLSDARISGVPLSQGQRENSKEVITMAKGVWEWHRRRNWTSELPTWKKPYIFFMTCKAIFFL